MEGEYLWRREDLQKVRGSQGVGHCGVTGGSGGGGLGGSSGVEECVIR